MKAGEGRGRLARALPASCGRARGMHPKPPPWPSMSAWKGSPAVLPSWSQQVGLGGSEFLLMSGYESAAQSPSSPRSNSQDWKTSTRSCGGGWARLGVVEWGGALLNTGLLQSGCLPQQSMLCTAEAAAAGAPPTWAAPSSCLTGWQPGGCSRLASLPETKTAPFAARSSGNDGLN